jgi:hypothetical protein
LHHRFDIAAPKRIKLTDNSQDFWPALGFLVSQATINRLPVDGATALLVF